MKKFIIYIILFVTSLNITISNEIQDFQLIIKSGMSYTKIKESKKPQLNINYYRPNMQSSYESPMGYFLIHFDTSGINAVDLTDNNKNNIPDYIDSVAFYFDYVYNFQVNELGMKSPLPDSGEGGSDDYDIYVLDIGNGELYNTFYGLTFNDKIIFPKLQYDRFTAFTVIDNDYSPKDSTIIDSTYKVATYSTNGIEALKITAAHEFNHAVQFRYGINPYDFDLIAEMTSIAVEKVTFVTSTDYVKYVNDLIKHLDKYIFSEPSPESGYRYGIFLIYLIQKYDSSIIRKIWENIQEFPTCYEAINQVLLYYESNLNDEYCAFVNEIIKSSFEKESNIFLDANLFDNPKNKSIEKFGVIDYVNNQAKNYQINYKVFVDTLSKNQDSINFIFTLMDYDNLISKVNKLYKYSIIMRKGFDQGYTQLSNTDYYYSISNSNFYCVNYIISFNTKLSDDVISFPSPYRYGSYEKIYFTVPPELDEDLVKLVIYDNSFQVLFERVLAVRFRGEFKVVELDDLPPEMKPGVYLFSTGNHSQRYFGKFIIIE